MRGRVLAAAAVTAALVLTTLPAAAAVPTGFMTIADGGDGIISQGEASAVVVNGTYDGTFFPPITSVTIRIIADGGCASLPVGPPTSTPHQTVGVSGGTFQLTFNVSSLNETGLCAEAYLSNADGNSALFFSANRPVLDLTGPTNPVIVSPDGVHLEKVTIRANGRRVVPVQGTTDPNTAVEIFEVGLGSLGSTVSGADKMFNIDVVMTDVTPALQSRSGTFTIFAVATDGIGNTATSDPVTFSLDADAPTGRIRVPAGETIVGPGQPLILEGTAQDTNGQAFGGVLAVEINIHSTLKVEETILPPDTGRGNILGLAQVGDIIHQENAACTGCPALGVTQVDWEFDASFLPPGVYTFQIEVFDKAGNTADQPETVRVIVLP
jgi:hypothetical protein